MLVACIRVLLSFTHLLFRITYCPCRVSVTILLGSMLSTFLNIFFKRVETDIQQIDIGRSKTHFETRTSLKFRWTNRNPADSRIGYIAIIRGPNVNRKVQLRGLPKTSTRIRVYCYYKSMIRNVRVSVTWTVSHDGKYVTLYRVIVHSGNKLNSPCTRGHDNTHAATDVWTRRPGERRTVAFQVVLKQ